MFMAERPSWFEMVARERLVQGFKPAMRHLCWAVAERQPALAWLLHWHNELFASLVYLLEDHYLNLYEGTFAENFYGLKRIVQGQQKGTGLSETAKREAIFFLVAVPYLRDHLESLYETQLELRQDGLPPSQEPGRRLLLRFYPLVHSIYEAVHFGFQLAYLFGASDAFSPWLYLTAQRIQRLTMEDMLRYEKRRKEASRRQNLKRQLLHKVWEEQVRQQGWFSRLHQFLSRCGRIIVRNLKWALLVCLVAFKFAEWWYSAANVLGTRRKLPIPPPPPPVQIPREAPTVPSDKKLCPLCKRGRANPAAAPSGFVFCYPCIHAHVTQHGCCPVTRLHCSVDQICRIYTDS
eukprot:gb/GEZN01009609.1/.p1 GENE.gb/GEZN01009609.1/~~gb/GEZN01009609.1/.p1  ORF type:complete len:349 (+),score=29.34 gb/GEZN01009609.1/:69-1115(+)